MVEAVTNTTVDSLEESDGSKLKACRAQESKVSRNGRVLKELFDIQEVRRGIPEVTRVYQKELQWVQQGYKGNQLMQTEAIRAMGKRGAPHKVSKMQQQELENGCNKEMYQCIGNSKATTAAKLVGFLRQTKRSGDQQEVSVASKGRKGESSRSNSLKIGQFGH